MVSSPVVRRRNSQERREGELFSEACFGRTFSVGLCSKYDPETFPFGRRPQPTTASSYCSMFIAPRSPHVPRGHHRRTFISGRGNAVRYFRPRAPVSSPPTRSTLRGYLFNIFAAETFCTLRATELSTIGTHVRTIGADLPIPHAPTFCAHVHPERLIS